jgi:hypothetical protein
MVEHHVRDVGVAGSNPATPTTISLGTSTHSDFVASALINYCDSYCDRNVSGPTNRRRARIARSEPRRLHRGDHARARLRPRADGRTNRDELAAASAERMVAGGKSIEVARVKITDAGRRALMEETFSNDAA